MTLATALCVSLLCIGVCHAARNDASPVFACNLKAISAADRPRYNDLVKRLRAAIRNHQEISNGYTFKLDSQAVSLPETEEWVHMERLCCPFLTIQLSTPRKQADSTLTLTGPPGVKPLLAAEFPMR